MRMTRGWCILNFLVTISFIYEPITTSQRTVDTSKRVSANIPGDFIIGALFSLHHPPSPSQKRNGPGQFLACGQIRELYGIQRAEVAFQIIDEINNNPNLLPNITLGVEIRDSCWYAPVSLQQSIELIRDSLSPTTSDRCNSDEKFIHMKPLNDFSKSPSNRKYKQTLIGIIGPGSSSAALQTQNLLQLFSIPQIGYSTTSKDLSDKARYSTFLRVVPSDYYQAQVMVDVVKKFNWTYVSAVNTDENYGQSGIQAFRELAEKNGVCIAKEASILSNADNNSFDLVLNTLNTDDSANVVVCFCEGMTVRELLKAMKRLNLTDRFLLIGSDGWADRADVVEEYERQALGAISIRIHSPYVEEFDPYYFALKLGKNYRNPWFQEFWQHKFNCVTNISAVTVNTTLCTGNESLSDRYKQEPKLSFVIKAIYTMAYALDQLQKSVCGENITGICPSMYPFNGTLFLTHLMNVSFSFGPDNDVVEFDNKGDPPGRYDIMNYQRLENGSFEYIQVGSWNNGSLNFFKDLQEFSKGHVESVCSKPCSIGHYKNFHTGQEKHCCWVCVKCDRHQYLLNETHCIDCDYGYWPDSSQTKCLQIPVEFMQWIDVEAIVAISSSVLGFLLTGVVFIIFVRHNNTPVVKASTRELCYLILIGMIISHASVFSILTKPSMWSCLFSRTLPGISFSMIYASLLVKTNRIARILAGSKKRFPTKKPKFMSATAQLVITSLLISIEVSVAIAMLFIEPPDTEFQYPTRQRTILACNTTRRGIIAPLGFIFLLIGLCTIYAWKTRNVPENFNEAKFIGFAMYCTCVIWIAFVPIYFGSESKIITMCLCISLSAMVTLVFLFLPKLYIIIIRPEKNIRALFTTSKTIRCHIGSNLASAIYEKSSFSSRSCDYEKEYSIEGNLIIRKRPKIENESVKLIISVSE